MRVCVIALWIMMSVGLHKVWSQVSSDCSTAIPICSNTPINGGTNGIGMDDFNGFSSTGCITQASGTVETNSAWYRFRTGASGELGFNIGFDASEDWDFALYRSNDCNNLGEPVRCNFFNNEGNEIYMGVGEDPTGDTDTVLYEEWLQVSPGEDYYLLVNNFSNTNTGFSIQFTGAIFSTNPHDALDCSIISNLLGPPISVCENENVVLDATTMNASSYDWFMDTGSGFLPIAGEHDPTLTVTVSALYRVSVFTTDGSLILSDVQVFFTTPPVAFLISDVVFCSDTTVYDLSQKDSEVLGGQNINAYIVSYHGSMSDAVDGINALPQSFSVTSGSQTVYTRVFSVVNPNCFDASQTFQITAVEAPSVDFPLEVFLCEGIDTATIGDVTPNANYSYVWNSGEATPTIGISQAGTYVVRITNHVGGFSCETTVNVTVVISRTPVIMDVIVEDLQNNNSITVIPQIDGDFEYRLDDGEYQSSAMFNDIVPGAHTVTVNDLNGCGSDTETITVVGFPKFFTPNGDGVNDEWQIDGITQLEAPVVLIYDRYGKFLKQLDQNSPGWDGTFNGRDLPSSDYWFKLSYIDSQGQHISAKFIDNHFSLRR